MRLWMVAGAMIWLNTACDRLRLPGHSSDLPPDWLVDYVQRIDSELVHVDTSDGVDASEAKAIAGVYMGKYVTGCGAPDVAALEGNTWVVSLRTGVAGKKSDRSIEVDSRTGAVWGLGGPRYRDFNAFRYGVLIKIARDGH